MQPLRLSCHTHTQAHTVVHQIWQNLYSHFRRSFLSSPELNQAKLKPKPHTPRTNCERAAAVITMGRTNTHKHTNNGRKRGPSVSQRMSHTGLLIRTPTRKRRLLLFRLQDIGFWLRILPAIVTRVFNTLLSFYYEITFKYICNAFYCLQFTEDGLL